MSFVKIIILNTYKKSLDLRLLTFFSVVLVKYIDKILLNYI